MSDPVERFYEAYEDAESSINKMLGILREVDKAEGELARKLRASAEVLGDVRDDVEENGF